MRVFVVPKQKENNETSLENKEEKILGCWWWVVLPDDYSQRQVCLAMPAAAVCVCVCVLTW